MSDPEQHMSVFSRPGGLCDGRHRGPWRGRNGNWGSGIGGGGGGLMDKSEVRGLQE